MEDVQRGPALSRDPGLEVTVLGDRLQQVEQAQTFSNVVAGSPVSAAVRCRVWAEGAAIKGFESLVNERSRQDHAPSWRGLPPPDCRAQGVAVLARRQLVDRIKRGVGNTQLFAMRFQPPARRPLGRRIAVGRQMDGKPLGVETPDEVKAVDQFLRAAGEVRSIEHIGDRPLQGGYRHGLAKAVDRRDAVRSERGVVGRTKRQENSVVLNRPG